MSMLEDSASYLDGTIYNLEAKVTNFDENESMILMMLAQTMNSPTPPDLLSGTSSQDNKNFSP